jgi:protein-disulfide isomerase
VTTTTRRARTRRERDRAANRKGSGGNRRTWLNLPTMSAVAFLVGAIIVAAAILLNEPPASGPSTASPVVPAVAGTFRDLPTAGTTLGRADAPVTIDLYEDFQCPACRRWGDSVLPSLVANELAAGTAKVVFHDFAFIGPESFEAARAGHAAAAQGRFWELWATIYANQGAENSGALSRDRLVDMARGLGLDVDRFQADMAEEVAGPAVDASIAAARRLGVDSTPTIVVDGRLLVGASYEDIAAAVIGAAGR